MKKLMVTCALLTCATVGAFAQNSKAPGKNVATAATPGQPAPLTPMSRPANAPSPEQMKLNFVENQARAFERQYGLTKEQYKGIYAACMEHINKQNEMEAKNKQMTTQDYEKLLFEKDAKFKKVMNAAQYAKYISTRTKPVPQPGPSVGQQK